MRVKILTYNIFCGFYGQRRVFEPERLRHVQNVVAAEDPDIVVFTEAYFGKPNDEGILLDYRTLFPFPQFAYGQTRKNSSSGNCVLTKYPILSSKLFPLATRKGMRARLRIGGKVLHLDVIWPHPFISDAEKISALRPALLSRRSPYVLTGDFNALSDEDDYDERKFLLAFRKFTKEKGDSESLRFLERQFIPFLRSSGLRDAMPVKNRTYTIPSDYCSADKDSAMRIDYCFVSSDVHVLDSYVVQTEDAEWGSDHRPIVTVIELQG